MASISVFEVAAGGLRLQTGFAGFLQFGFEGFAVDHGETSLLVFSRI